MFTIWWSRVELEQPSIKEWLPDSAGAEDGGGPRSPQDSGAPLHTGRQTGAAYMARTESQSSRNFREDQLMLLYPWANEDDATTSQSGAKSELCIRGPPNCSDVVFKRTRAHTHTCSVYTQTGAYTCAYIYSHTYVTHAYTLMQAHIYVHTIHIQHLPSSSSTSLWLLGLFFCSLPSPRLVNLLPPSSACPWHPQPAS